MWSDFSTFVTFVTKPQIILCGHCVIVIKLDKRQLLPDQPSENPYTRSTRVLQRLSTGRRPGARGSMGFDASTEYFYRKLS